VREIKAIANKFPLVAPFPSMGMAHTLYAPYEWEEK